MRNTITIITVISLYKILAIIVDDVEFVVNYMKRRTRRPSKPLNVARNTQVDWLLHAVAETESKPKRACQQVIHQRTTD